MQQEGFMRAPEGRLSESAVRDWALYVKIVRKQREQWRSVVDIMIQGFVVRHACMGTGGPCTHGTVTAACINWHLIEGMHIGFSDGCPLLAKVHRWMSTGQICTKCAFDAHCMRPQLLGLVHAHAHAVH